MNIGVKVLRNQSYDKVNKGAKVVRKLYDDTINWTNNQKLRKRT